MSQYQNILPFKSALRTSNPNVEQPNIQTFYDRDGSAQQHPQQRGTSYSSASAANMPIFPEEESSASPLSSFKSVASKPRNFSSQLLAQALAAKSDLGLLGTSISSEALQALRSYGSQAQSVLDSPGRQTNMNQNFSSHSQMSNPGFRQDSPSQASSFSSNAQAEARNSYNQDTDYYNQGGTRYNQGNVQFDQVNVQYSQGNVPYNQDNVQYKQGSVPYNQGDVQYNQGNVPYNHQGDDHCSQDNVQNTPDRNTTSFAPFRPLSEVNTVEDEDEFLYGESETVPSTESSQDQTKKTTVPEEVTIDLSDEDVSVVVKSNAGNIHQSSWEKESTQKNDGKSIGIALKDLNWGNSKAWKDDVINTKSVKRTNVESPLISKRAKELKMITNKGSNSPLNRNKGSGESHMPINYDKVPLKPLSSTGSKMSSETTMSDKSNASQFLPRATKKNFSFFNEPEKKSRYATAADALRKKLNLDKSQERDISPNEKSVTKLLDVPAENQSQVSNNSRKKIKLNTLDKPTEPTKFPQLLINVEHGHNTSSKRVVSVTENSLLSTKIDSSNSAKSISPLTIPLNIDKNNPLSSVTHSSESETTEIQRRLTQERSEKLSSEEIFPIVAKGIKSKQAIPKRYLVENYPIPGKSWSPDRHWSPDMSPSFRSRDRSPSFSSRDHSPSSRFRDRSPIYPSGDRSRPQVPRYESGARGGRLSREKSPRRRSRFRSRGRSPRHQSRGRSPRHQSRGRSPRHQPRGRSPRHQSRGRSPRHKSRGRSPRERSSERSKRSQDRSPHRESEERLPRKRLHSPEYLVEDSSSRTSVRRSNEDGSVLQTKKSIEIQKAVTSESSVSFKTSNHKGNKGLFSKSLPTNAVAKIMQESQVSIAASSPPLVSKDIQATETLGDLSQAKVTEKHALEFDCIDDKRMILDLYFILQQVKLCNVLNELLSPNEENAEKIIEVEKSTPIRDEYSESELGAAILQTIPQKESVYSPANVSTVPHSHMSTLPPPTVPVFPHQTIPILPQVMPNLPSQMYPQPYPYGMHPFAPNMPPPYPPVETNFPYNPMYPPPISPTGSYYPPPSMMIPSTNPFNPIDFDSTQPTKRQVTRTCTLKSIPVCPSTPVEKSKNEDTLSVSQKDTSKNKVAVTSEKNTNLATIKKIVAKPNLDSDNLQKEQNLVSKYKKLKEERDIIQKILRNTSNETIEVKKLKDDLEKRSIKVRSNADKQVIIHCANLYRDVNEELNRYIAEAKRLNGEMQELERNIKLETLQKLGKKPEISEPSSASSSLTYTCIDNKNHWCEHCRLHFDSVVKMIEHLHTERHIKCVDPFKTVAGKEPPKEIINKDTKLEPLQGSEFIQPIYAYYCTLCDEPLLNEVHAERHLKGNSHYLKYKGFIKENPFYERKRALFIAATTNATNNQAIFVAAHQIMRKQPGKTPEQLKMEADAHKKVKDMLLKQKENEKRVDELDEINADVHDSPKKTPGIKLTLINEKEKPKSEDPKTTKESEVKPKQKVIYIGRLPNYKPRPKPGEKKAALVGKSVKSVGKKQSFLEKSSGIDTESIPSDEICEKIRKPAENTTINEKPAEKCEPVTKPALSSISSLSHIPIPKPEIFVTPSRSNQASPLITKQDSPKPEITKKVDKASKPNQAENPKKNKSVMSGCQSEAEAKVSGTVDEHKTLKKVKKREKVQTFEPKTDNLLVNQALKNILYGSTNMPPTVETRLSDIKLPEMPPKMSSSPSNSPKVTEKIEVGRRQKPLTEEEKDFLLLGINKCDMVPLVIPKPPPYSLIHDHAEIIARLPPFPPPLQVPPPNLVLQRSPMKNPLMQFGSYPSSANYFQPQTPVMDRNSDIIDMEIDPEIIASKIVVVNRASNITPGRATFGSPHSNRPFFGNRSECRTGKTYQPSESGTNSIAKPLFMEHKRQPNIAQRSVAKTVVDDVSKHNLEKPNYSLETATNEDRLLCIELLNFVIDTVSKQYVEKYITDVDKVIETSKPDSAMDQSEETAKSQIIDSSELTAINSSLNVENSTSTAVRNELSLAENPNVVENATEIIENRNILTDGERVASLEHRGFEIIGTTDCKDSNSFAVLVPEENTSEVNSDPSNNKIEVLVKNQKQQELSISKQPENAAMCDETQSENILTEGKKLLVPMSSSSDILVQNNPTCQENDGMNEEKSDLLEDSQNVKIEASSTIFIEQVQLPADLSCKIEEEFEQRTNKENISLSNVTEGKTITEIFQEVKLINEELPSLFKNSEDVNIEAFAAVIEQEKLSPNINYKVVEEFEQRTDKESTSSSNIIESTETETSSSLLFSAKSTESKKKYNPMTEEATFPCVEAIGQNLKCEKAIVDDTLSVVQISKSTDENHSTNTESDQKSPGKTMVSFIENENFLNSPLIPGLEPISKSNIHEHVTIKEVIPSSTGNDLESMEVEDTSTDKSESERSMSQRLETGLESGIEEQVPEREGISSSVIQNLESIELETTTHNKKENKLSMSQHAESGLGHTSLKENFEGNSVSDLTEELGNEEMRRKEKPLSVLNPECLVSNADIKAPTLKEICKDLVQNSQSADEILLFQSPETNTPIIELEKAATEEISSISSSNLQNIEVIDISEEPDDIFSVDLALESRNTKESFLSSSEQQEKSCLQFLRRDIQIAEERSSCSVSTCHTIEKSDVGEKKNASSFVGLVQSSQSNQELMICQSEEQNKPFLQSPKTSTQIVDMEEKVAREISSSPVSHLYDIEVMDITENKGVVSTEEVSVGYVQGSQNTEESMLCQSRELEKSCIPQGSKTNSQICESETAVVQVASSVSLSQDTEIMDVREDIELGEISSSPVSHLHDTEVMDITENKGVVSVGYVQGSQNTEESILCQSRELEKSCIPQGSKTNSQIYGSETAVLEVASSVSLPQDTEIMDVSEDIELKIQSLVQESGISVLCEKINIPSTTKECSSLDVTGHSKTDVHCDTSSKKLNFDEQGLAIMSEQCTEYKEPSSKLTDSSEVVEMNSESINNKQLISIDQPSKQSIFTTEAPKSDEPETSIVDSHSVGKDAFSNSEQISCTVDLKDNGCSMGTDSTHVVPTLIAIHHSQKDISIQLHTDANENACADSNKTSTSNLECVEGDLQFTSSIEPSVINYENVNLGFVHNLSEASLQDSDSSVPCKNSEELQTASLSLVQNVSNTEIIQDVCKETLTNATELQPDSPLGLVHDNQSCQDVSKKELNESMDSFTVNPESQNENIESSANNTFFNRELSETLGNVEKTDVNMETSKLSNLTPDIDIPPSQMEKSLDSCGDIIKNQILFDGMQEKVIVAPVVNYMEAVLMDTSSQDEIPILKPSIVKQPLDECCEGASLTKSQPENKYPEGIFNKSIPFPEKTENEELKKDVLDGGAVVTAQTSSEELIPDVAENKPQTENLLSNIPLLIEIEQENKVEMDVSGQEEAPPILPELNSSDTKQTVISNKSGLFIAECPLLATKHEIKPEEESEINEKLPLTEKMSLSFTEDSCSMSDSVSNSAVPCLEKFDTDDSLQNNMSNDPPPVLSEVSMGEVVSAKDNFCIEITETSYSKEETGDNKEEHSKVPETSKLGKTAFRMEVESPTSEELNSLHLEKKRGKKTDSDTDEYEDMEQN